MKVSTTNYLSQTAVATENNGSEGVDESKTDTLKKAFLAIESLKHIVADTRRRASEPVAVVGVACRLPGGSDSPESYWQMLCDGENSAQPIPESRWNIDKFYNPVPSAPGKMYVSELNFIDGVENFDCQFFGITPKEALCMDPQQRVLLEVMWHALENAGIPAATLKGSDASVFMGQSTGDYMLRLNRYTSIDQMNGFVATGNSYSVLAGRISYLLGLNGPCMTIDTACSTSMVCLNQALQALRQGSTGLAFVGAINLMISPESCVALSHAQALAPDGRSKPFDDSADGYGRGEGGVVLVLKRLGDAERDGNQILALVEETAINQDGTSGGLMMPNGDSQAQLIRQVLEKSALKPDDIQYIEAHGTGTQIGDPIEVAAIGATLGSTDRQSPLLMGSCKANIGHLEAASGMAALLKVVLMLHHRKIVKQAGFSTPSRYIDWASMAVEVPSRTCDWNIPGGAVRRAGVNGFGFSGMNGHAILREYVAAPVDSSKPDCVAVRRPLSMLAISAKTSSALRRQAEEYAQALARQDYLAVCRAASQQRDHWPHRLVVSADSGEQAQSALALFATGEDSKHIVTGSCGRTPGTVFMFTGQGSQYAGMGKLLYEYEPVFRNMIDRCCVAVKDILGCDLATLMFDSDDDTLSNTAYTQPALYALEVALAHLLQSWGVQPQVVVGHSVGQYAAACIAGIFSVEDGARLIAKRGQLMSQLPKNGGMLVVAADLATVKDKINAEPLVSIAAINGPWQTVISGDKVVLEALAVQFASAKVSSRFLLVSNAFHSPLIEPMLEDFRELAAQLQYSPPKLKLGCNLRGNFADPEEISTADYWVRHAREPVSFMPCIDQLLDAGFDCFIEVGPAPILCAMGEVIARQRDTSAQWIPALQASRRGLNDSRSMSLQSEQLAQWSQILRSLAEVYCSGVDLAWPVLLGTETVGAVRLPNYPFEEKRFWPGDDESELQASNGALPTSSPLRKLQGEDSGAGVAELVADLQSQGAISTEQGPFASQLLLQLAAQHNLAREYDDLSDWFYELRWEKKVLVGSRAGDYRPAHYLLIQATEDLPFSSRLRELLLGRGHTVSVLLVNEQIAERIALLGPVDHCIVLSHWRLSADPAGAPELDFANVRALSVDLLLQALQAFERCDSQARLWIPTRQVWGEDCQDNERGHLHGPLWSMARNLYREMPHRLGAAIDCASDSSEVQLLDTIDTINRQELWHEYQWMLRGDDHYVARLAAVKSLPASQAQRWQLDATSTYLITGAFGGIGLSLADLLIERGARHLLLVSRSGPRSDASQQALARWRSQGVEATCLKLDIADAGEVHKLIGGIDQAAPLKGVLHTAGVTADGMLNTLTPENFEKVFVPKMNGTWILDRATRELSLDFFLCFSSSSALVGAPGLANYAAANFYMDVLMEQRRAFGLPGISIQWGSWAQVGMAADLGATHLKRQASQGWQLIATRDGLRALERIMLAAESGQAMPRTPIVMPVADWSRVLTVLGGGKDAFFTDVAGELGDLDEFDSGAEAAVAALLALPAKDQLPALTAKLKAKIAIGFGFADDELSVNESLVSLGMDSLLAVQLKMALQSMLDVDLPMEVLLEGASIAELANYILDTFKATVPQATSQLVEPQNEYVDLAL